MKIIYDMEYSKTEPKVCEGDLVVLGDGTQLLVREIKNGIPYGCTFGNNELSSGPYAHFATAKICCKYRKVELSDNWKLPDGTPFNQYIVGIDPISGELPSCVMHTRSMSVEDIIKEYGDILSEEALEALKGIKTDNEKELEDVYDKGVTPKSFMDFVKQKMLRQLEEDAAKWFIATSPANRYSKSNVVHQPWGSYTPTKDGFFIPPVRKPYEPDFVQFSGRHKRHTIEAHLLGNTWCNSGKPTTDWEEIIKVKNDYNTLVDELYNKEVTTEKLEAVVEYLSEVIRKNLSSKKIAKVFRKIRKIYG